MKRSFHGGRKSDCTLPKSLNLEFQKLIPIIQGTSGLSQVEKNRLIQRLDHLLVMISILEVIRYKLPSPFQTAEDIRQELWKKVFSGNFRVYAWTLQGRPLFPLLMKSLRNSCIDLKRKQIRRKTWEWEGGDSDSSEDVLRAAQWNNLWEVVRTEIARLPDREREALEKRFFDGKSPRDISWETGVPRSTVNVQIFRTLAKLRGHLYGKDLWPIDPSWK